MPKKPQPDQAAVQPVDPAKELQKSLELTTEQRIDRYAAYALWYRDWKALNKSKLDAIEEGAKFIRSLYSDKPGNEHFEAQGERYTVIVGPKENQSTVNLNKAKRRWGMKTLWGLFKIGKGALEEAVGKEEAVFAIEYGRTGPRDLTPVQKPEQPPI